MQQITNPLTEIGMLIMAGLLIIGGVLLLYASKIDFTASTVMFGSALALFGGNLALKAPSPAQQAQLQSLTAQVLANQQPAQPAGQVPLAEVQLRPGQAVAPPPQATPWTPASPEFGAPVQPLV